tara:strand:+ start:72 stop:473 length:402 start_codon:yes stop_codon:yes gene_type:complete
MSRLNYFINILNLSLIFIYFIFININLIKKEFGFILIFLIIINLIIKLYIWYNFNITKKQYLNIIINNIFFNDRLIKLSIFILSIAIPIYMIFQKDSLVINLFIEKLSFLLVFISSSIGFYLEFFILESESRI